MAINYPTSLDTLSNPVGTDKVNNATPALVHSTQHSNANDILEALEAKVGINGSAVTTSHDYKLSEVITTDKAVGKSATQTLTNKTIDGNNNTLTVLAGTQLSGVTPLANGGTGVSLTDPNADRVLFWDDSAGNVAYLQVGSGLSISGTNLIASGTNITTTQTASENITIGTPVGISNISGGVARAVRYASTASLGYTLHNTNLYTNNQTEIGGDKFVVLGYQLSNDSLYASVGTIDRDTLSASLGTAVAATADVDNPLHCVCKLDTDKFIVFYKEDASTSITKYRVGTVSGSTITFGSAATFYDNADTITGIRCAQIGTDKGVVFIVANTTTATRVLAFTVSGTTATVGTGVTPDANVRVESAIQKIDTDKFIIASTSTYAQVGTISGTTITLGSAVDYTASTIASDGLMEIVSPATDKAVIRFTVGSTETLIACTISGTVPTFGTQVSGSTSTNGLITTDASTLLTGSNGKIYKYTLSGTTLTYNSEVFSPTGTLEALIYMANSYFVGMNGGTSTLDILIQGMSNSFMGIAQSTVTRGNTVDILINGVDTNQTGLTPGTYYEVSSGALSLIASSSTSFANRVKSITSTSISL